MKLGYFKGRNNGVCAGITMAWISACLTSEEQEAKYLRFTKEIADQGSNLLDKITKMQSKVSRKEKLSEDDKELFQYIAFYEQIALYLSPGIYPKLFGKSINDLDIEIVSQIANSVPLQEKGGLSVVYSDPGIYTKDELITYLTMITELLPSDAGTIALSLSNHNHSLGLIYNHKNHSWKFMDINQGNPQELTINVLAEKILNGFNIPERTLRHEFTAINTIVISADEPLKRDSLKTSLQALKEEYRKLKPIGPLAEREGEVNLLWISSLIGDKDVVKACLDAKNDINQANENGATPLLMAAQNGHVDVVNALLAKEGIELNKALPAGETPLYMAAENGHVEVVNALLAKEGIDLNKADQFGITPLIIATTNGHVEVIKVLLAEANKTIPDTEVIFALINEEDCAHQTTLSKVI